MSLPGDARIVLVGHCRIAFSNDHPLAGAVRACPRGGHGLRRCRGWIHLRGYPGGAW
jgi:hypothetical protein